MSMTVGDIIDILVLILLAATIFYAWRLSLYLKIFREGRAEMEGLVGKLDAAIERAEKSVLGMRNAAESAGQKLNDTVREAKFLGDELNFMNDAGNSLANRLEKLAEKNRILVEKIENAGGVGAMGDYKKMMPEDEDAGLPRGSFSAQENRPSSKDLAPPPAEAPAFGSQAERELYEALTRKSGGSRK